jgi:conjugative transfer signal peptidase TraF
MVRTIAPAIVLGTEAVRLQVLVAAVIAIALLLAPAVATPTPLLVWNASPSVPIGLYAVARIFPHPGDLAVVRLPADMALLAASRTYLPQSAYLLKPVVAAAGDEVCRHSDRIFVNGRLMALARWADRIGRSLPVWQGCHTLAAHEFFLIADHPDSFDSRYFGPLAHEHIVGRGFLIW